MTRSYASTINGKDKLFFIKLLLKWSGSVYQAVYIELILFLICYGVVAITYRCALNVEQQISYRQFFNYVKKLQSGTPLSFLLGFFVAAMIGRWWSVYFNIPWMSKSCFLLTTYIPPNVYKKFKCFKDKERPVDEQLRRNILRYLNLAWVLQMTSLASSMHERFKEFNKKKKKSIEERLAAINRDQKVRETFGKLVTNAEIKTFAAIAREKGESTYDANIPYWAPLHWASQLLRHGYDAGLIAGDAWFKELINLIQDFRSTLGSLWMYMDSSVPLVYSQVVVIAVYTYFIAEIFTTQIPPHNIRIGNKTEVHLDVNFIMDTYVPIESLIKFLFYVGWFKVAVALMNPLGTDAQDFPVQEIFDGNLEASIERGDPKLYMYPQALNIDHQDFIEEVDDDDSPDFKKIKEAYSIIYACDGSIEEDQIAVPMNITTNSNLEPIKVKTQPDQEEAEMIALIQSTKC